ncbi:uncharacterized protein LOC106163384 [Lingula anatina]|uniref:Uncharacterized protein LOC106163384 n=1 Tax=Lingula anatina TaxID=7574 RepID=A0A1S3IEW3_LINAN|nr:uncharacterized protein LOC106163384 [Lingula anatina]XP_013396397.1 uncharacterized protein LOC106163384 [Lingula anatina]|eukprot:XP_013396396.1 uncharacterized protein LOC106163384 [Lingula anatina]
MKICPKSLVLVASTICFLGLYQLLSVVIWLRFMNSGYLNGLTHLNGLTARKEDIKLKNHIQDTRSITCKNTTVKRLDPCHPSILPYITHSPPLKCRRQTSVAESKVDGDGYLMLIIKHYSRVTDNIHCYYQYIRHPTKPYKEDEAFVLSKRIDLPPANRVKLQEDFVYVSCMNKSGYKVYENFHLHMVKRAEFISEKYTEITGYQPRLNVLIVINDGVSMSSAVRYLPKTTEYLRKAMNGIIFSGYHTVGENSLPNLFPLLTGLPQSEASIDSPFIWNHFSEQGYKTFYLEDKIYATFTYIDPEPTRPPTDFYTHPFWVAMENSSLYWDSQTFCLGNDPIHRIALQYLEYYIKNYQRHPYFGLYFFNELTHDVDSPIQLADVDYRNFLKEHNERGYFNNTIIFFMSDHGARFGRFRSTPIGRLEASNPLLIMVLPKWLRQQYPHIAAAVNSNTERLVTSYDIHSTLVDILHSDIPTYTESINGKKRREGIAKGISLFRNLPSRRTCASAGIPEDTCTLCTPLEPTFLDINSRKARFIANAVLTKINNVLVNATSECDILRISDITYIAVTSYSRFFVTYIVVIKTVPGSGIFEASVRETRDMVSVSTESQYTVMTPVIRLSLYDNNCCCTEDSRIKKYCHCKVTRRQLRRKAAPKDCYQN